MINEELLYRLRMELTARMAESVPMQPPEAVTTLYRLLGNLHASYPIKEGILSNYTQLARSLYDLGEVNHFGAPDVYKVGESIVVNTPYYKHLVVDTTYYRLCKSGKFEDRAWDVGDE